MRVAQALNSMHTHYNVRPFHPADTQAFLALDEAVFGKGWAAEDFNRTMAIPGTHLLLAEIHEDMVGYILYRLLGEEGEIVTCGVSLPARHKGIASNLCAKMQDDMREHGVKKLWLEVAIDNAAAKALYIKQGFKPVSTRKAYYAREESKPVDAWIMELSL